ncbi:MAG: site-2 protease family protein [Firmicutes bacterium]|nr:site-2 protease family protein [Bacillota bacterium]
MFVNRFRNVNPVFAVFMIMMLFSSMRSYTSVGDWFFHILMVIPGVIVGISFHEFAHGWAALKMGDPTAKFQGRLTVNPAAHIDPVGFIALMFCGFGWGRPVEVNPNNFKNRRKGEIIVSLAGVVMNLIIAVLTGVVIKLIVTFAGWDFISTSLGNIIFTILILVIQINLVLMVFNLIPVPPLDGFTVITEIFNLRFTKTYYTMIRYGYFILLALILFDVTQLVISPCVGFFMDLITNLIIY